MKVLVLGSGKMVSAMLTGLQGSVDMSGWGIFSPGGESSRVLAEKIGAIKVTTATEFNDPDYILIGCKPQQLRDLKTLIGDSYQDATFISVLAALSEDTHLKILGAKKLIRLMPNLPVKVRAGVVLMSSQSAAADLPAIESLFRPLGHIEICSEQELEELTLLTGSGPGLLYEFARELSKINTSLTESKREELARKVLEGSGLMLKGSSEPLGTLVNNVTSKGGVTIAVLEKWRELKWNELLAAGFAAGKKRADELRELLRQS